MGTVEGESMKGLDEDKEMYRELLTTDVMETDLLIFDSNFIYF